MSLQIVFVIQMGPGKRSKDWSQIPPEDRRTKVMFCAPVQPESSQPSDTVANCARCFRQQSEASIDSRFVTTQNEHLRQALKGTDGFYIYRGHVISRLGSFDGIIFSSRSALSRDQTPHLVNTPGRSDHA